MNKYFTLFLVFAIAVSAFAPQAFAQLNWRVDTEINTGLLSWNLPTGEKAEKFITSNGNKVPNTLVYNPDGNRGNYSYDPGSMNFFSCGRGNWLRQNELRLTVDFQGDAVGFHLRTLLDPLVADITTVPGGSNSTTGNHSFVQGDGRTPNWNDFLRYSFDEWHLSGNAKFLTAFAGNTPNRGKVQDFGDFYTDDTLKTVKVDHYGVNLPTANADYNGHGQDANNFMRRPVIDPGSNADASLDWIMPYAMLGARFKAAIGNLDFPVTVQIAADPGNNSGITGTENYRRFNGAVRLSAEEIANAVTFDAVYRLRGGNPNIMDDYDEDYNTTGLIQPNGQGIAAHIFGIYANIINVPNFIFGLGYTGYTVTYDDKKDVNGDILKKSGPLYSGIDLRLLFTGLENVIITSANNLSFARSGFSTDDTISLSVLGFENDNFTARGWLAVYNALSFDYLFSKQLVASLQIANRYGLITTKESLPDGVEARKRIHNRLGGGVYIAYQFNRYLLVQGGVSFLYANSAYSDTAPGVQGNTATRDANGGTFDIAIPIRMNFVYEKK